MIAGWTKRSRSHCSTSSAKRRPAARASATSSKSDHRRDADSPQVSSSYAAGGSPAVIHEREGGVIVMHLAVGHRESPFVGHGLGVVATTPNQVGRLSSSRGYSIRSRGAPCSEAHFRRR